MEIYWFAVVISKDILIYFRTPQELEEYLRIWPTSVAREETSDNVEQV